MHRYIGMDVHAMSCTVCIVGPSGRQLKSDVVETNGQALVEYLRAIPRPRHLCFEEGTQSAWLHEILAPHVDELVVVAITQSRGAKSDAKDALGLAQALRLGAIGTSVFKAPSRFARLRALAVSYDQITRDVTRTQTRIKALFRARGISTQGHWVYSAAQRSQWLEKLPEACRPSAELLWQALDAQRKLKRDAEKQLIAESHRHPISEILEMCPGFGPIRTALAVPVVVTPHRFRTPRQLWSYSGLGIPWPRLRGGGPANKLCPFGVTERSYGSQKPG
jgi:transposase